MEITYSIILIFSLIVLSAVFKGFVDVLKFHYRDSFFSRFKNEKFWNPKISWLNKYNEILWYERIKEPKFFGSTTFLIWLTDGYHLLQMIYLNLLFLAFGIAFSTNFVLIVNKGITILLSTIVFSLLFKTVFEITYKLSYKE